MNDKQEKWAIFWCDLLKPIIFSDIEPEGEQAYLKTVAEQDVRFPDGRIGKPSLSTLRRKLRKYRNGGFHALQRKQRSDRGIGRNLDPEILSAAVELKKEQPYRSDRVINRFIQARYGVKIPRSTLYRHLKAAGATRAKLGICRKPVRKRWSRDHTHDLWVGDFEEGPYVVHDGEVRPTHLSAFIDCHSRFVVEARYYLRQNMDVLVDAMIRALAVHGAPLGVYLDNAKVYHSQGLKSALYRINARLIHRPKGDPAPGGVVERFFGTVQSQFEAEVRAGDILSLSDLNRAFSAWLAMAYHGEIHSETGQRPEDRYNAGLTVIRHVDMADVMDAFMRRVVRTVHSEFSDVQIDKRWFAVDPKLRGDRVEVRIDPFSHLDKVEVHSMDGNYLGVGVLHHRQAGRRTDLEPPLGKPQNSYLDLLKRQHDRQLDQQSRGIDYAGAVKARTWSFPDFANEFARLAGRRGGMSGFTAHELELLKKFHTRNPWIDRRFLKEAFQNAPHGSVAGVLSQLKRSRKEDA